MVYVYKGFRLSFVSQLSLDIDRDVSTAYCKSASSGHSADSLSGAIYTTVNVLVIGVLRTSLIVGGFRSFDPKHCWHYIEEGLFSHLLSIYLFIYLFDISIRCNAFHYFHSSSEG